MPKMPVLLKSIQFHTPDSTWTVPLADEFGDSPVAAPEWKRSEPDHRSSAAFIAAESRHAAITVTLSRGDKRTSRFELRALGEGNLMGGISACPLAFPKTGDLEVRLPLEGGRLSRVGVHDDELVWEARAAGGEWTQIAQTRHRVYVVLAAPGPPWESAPVWTEVLDKVCDWASGAASDTEMQDSITRRFYSLGEGDHPVLKSAYCAQYTSPGTFDCAHLLRTLDGKRDEGGLVACYDTASAVTTFANACGGRLSEALMGSHFDTAPVRLIGSTSFARSSFTNHEVAWANGAQASDRLWDAFLRLPPGPDKPDGELAQSMAFTDYAPKLTSQPCVPLNIRVVRSLGTVNPVYLGPRGPRPDPIHAEMTDRIRDTKPERSHFIWRLFHTRDLWPGWSMRRVLPIPGATPELDGFDSYWRRKDRTKKDEDILIRVRFSLFASARDARDWMVALLGCYAVETIPVNAGDVAFGLEDNTAVVFARGNMTVELMSVGQTPTSVLAATCHMDHLFKEEELLPGVAFPDRDTGDAVELPVRLTGSLGGRGVWYRLVTETGSIRAAGGRVLYTPRHTGAHSVTVSAVAGRTVVEIWRGTFRLQ